MSSAHDVVRAHLVRRGCPDFVVAAGLDGLLRRWGELGEALERGYDFGLDDWLNDLDTRQILSEVWGELPPAEAARRAPELEQADRQVRARTRPVASCLWGAQVAHERAWSAEHQWWYFLLPLRHGEELARDVGRGADA